MQETVPMRSTSPEPVKASIGPVSPPIGPNKHYVKTLRLTSDQLVRISASARGTSD